MNLSSASRTFQLLSRLLDPRSSTEPFVPGAGDKRALPLRPSAQPFPRAVPEEAFKRAKKHPAILHYAGDERPWKAGNLGHYRLAYDQYLAMTPWKGTPKEDKGIGQRFYLFAYHI